MHSHSERHAPRMVRLKQAQVQIALAAAQGQQTAAQARRSEADALRRSAQATLERALLAPEQGLSRSDLFDRLRTLAVARAHALETTHLANELETEVRRLEEDALALRQAAAVHQRKQKKLEHWSMQHSTRTRQRRERQRHNQEQEDFPCPRPAR